MKITTDKTSSGKCIVTENGTEPGVNRAFINTAYISYLVFTFVHFHNY